MADDERQSLHTLALLRRLDDPATSITEVEEVLAELSELVVQSEAACSVIVDRSKVASLRDQARDAG
jgi:hypothetical protein